MNPSPERSPDRKALARAYREARRPMGVYCVRHALTGQILIAHSIDLPSALNREQAALRFGGHHNRALQAAWKTYGPDGFTFEVLDTLEWPKDTPAFDPTADLLVLERLWRERLVPNDDASTHVSASTERSS